MSLTGIWSIGVATPIGTQSAALELTEVDGVVAGVVKNDTEILPLINPVLHGTRLTWQLRMTSPVTLNLTFDVTVNGDTLTGTAKAGIAILPSSRVTGTRVSQEPN